MISADEEQGFAYLPLTSATNDMYGGHRLGNNVFANTLVCIRCLTGERVWHVVLPTALAGIGAMVAGLVLGNIYLTIGAFCVATTG